MARKDEKKIDLTLKVNQRLDIMLSKVYTEQFSSRVEEVNSDALLIAMPMSKGYPVQLRPGDTFYARTVVDGAVYFFATTLLERTMTPLPLWKASLPTQVERVQQRSFVRVDATVPVKLEIPTIKADEPSLVCEAVTKDVSGGGLKVVYQHRFPVGTRMRLMLHLPEGGQVETEGEVVRVERPFDDRPIHWIAVRFLDMHETVRSKIIKFVFKKQMEQRQKGV